jgi:pyrroline-5-carboxylate reductase
MAELGRIGFVGMGRMGTAIAERLLASGTVGAAELAFTWKSDGRPHPLVAGAGVSELPDNAALWEWADTVVLAVKPQQLDAVAADLAGLSGEGKRVISLLAGTRARALLEALPSGARVMRTMPNTPALIGQGATAWYAAPGADDADKSACRALFEPTGASFEVDSEGLLDAVVGVSGSGPAYAFLFIEALADGGVTAGLPRGLALELAARTLLGAAALCLETGEHPGALKDQVMSPGGTTARAVHALEQAGFRGAVMDAVLAATERARELGEG